MPIKIALAKMAAIACVAGVVMAANLPLLAAHEAHVAYAEAKIINDSVSISPSGGKICEDGKFEISIKTAFAGAAIYYTADETMPECGKNGALYSVPLKISGSHTIKAVSCHGGKQSAVASSGFDVSADYCKPPLKINEIYPNSDNSREDGKNNASQNVLESADVPKKEGESNSGPEQKEGDNKKSDENTAGGIQAKPEDAPADVLIKSDAGDKSKDGLGGGDNQQGVENGEKISNDIMKKEEEKDVKAETVIATLPTINNGEELASSENASDSSSNADAVTAVLAGQSSDTSASQDLAIAPDGDDVAIEFSLNS